MSKSHRGTDIAKAKKLRREAGQITRNYGKAGPIDSEKSTKEHQRIRISPKNPESWEDLP